MSELIAKNRKAKYNYELLDKYLAGISLQGTEVKSLRDGAMNFGDAFCMIDGGEVWLKSLHISEYKQGNIHNHDPLRDRKLLLKKQEIQKLDKKIKEKGYSLVPTKLLFSNKGLCKVEIALAKGKKLYDKRESIKQKDLSKQLKKIDY